MKDSRRASEGGDAKLGLETLVPGRDIEKFKILEPWRQGPRKSVQMEKRMKERDEE